MKYKIPSPIFSDLDLLDVFSLSGSRSMAQRPDQESFSPVIMIGSQITEDTDWDFAAPHNESNHNALLSVGFTYFAPETLDYRDDLTVGIYEKTYHPKFDMSNPLAYTSPPRAQVSLRSDYALFKQVWDSIDPQFYYNHLWKRSPNYDLCERSEVKNTIRDILNQLFRTRR